MGHAAETLGVRSQKPTEAEVGRLGEEMGFPLRQLGSCSTVNLARDTKGKLVGQASYRLL
jgi:hypothetical protein